MDKLTICGEPEKAIFKGKSSDYVKLNVGGCLFQTNVATLTKQEDTMLAAMFSGRMEIQTDSEGWIMIDRCGKHFGTVLNFLRDGNVQLPKSKQDIAELLIEAKYYCIKTLEVLCDDNDILNKANLFQITPKTESDLNILLKSTLKPIVLLRFCVSPQNQDYFGLMYKNIVLFDNLLLGYRQRMVFIKYIFVSDHTLNWSFYSKGKKLAEVECNPFRVKELPEGEIYAETLKLLALVNE